MTPLQKLIVEIVEDNPAINGPKLVIRTKTRYPAEIGFDEFTTSVNILVAQGEIIEIQYVTPQMDYRIKSIYFPKGTKLEIMK